MRTTLVLDRFVDEDGDELGGGCTYLGTRASLTLDTTTVGALGDPTTIVVTLDTDER